VARHKLIESMTDGVIAIDPENRIIDINPSAIRHLGLAHPSPIGLPLDKLPFPLPDRGTHEVEIKTPEESPRYFNVRVENLNDRKTAIPGRLILIRDITEKKLAEEALNEANKKLRDQITKVEDLQTELREQALRDPLTGLYNRRHMEATLKLELERMAGQNQSLCILMIEIDSFKYFNDTYGHEAGDVTLQNAADVISGNIREGDTACRYGGDEFVAILPGASLDVGIQCANRLLNAIDRISAEFHGQPLPQITFSIGVAAYSMHGNTGDQTLRAADQAMYRAKREGKNRVVVAGD
jgi:diguanylate cyclase (GGDEF)-like protein/PAS domain S-box-containing protein